MKYMCGSCFKPKKLLNFIKFNKENSDKTEKVLILGIFSPKFILMFRGARVSKIGKKWPESSRILVYILS